MLNKQNYNKNIVRKYSIQLIWKSIHPEKLSKKELSVIRQNFSEIIDEYMLTTQKKTLDKSHQS